MRVTVPSLAKINLDLRVLHKRTDGFHELRTVFQTISLQDTLTIEYERARKTDLSVHCTVNIPDNLVVRAAKAALEVLKTNARIVLTVNKKIPMGAGMGGGSSNAAAVLLAFEKLAGLQRAASVAIGEKLGSDVPFFLFGGAALGMGRGTELYPLPDLPRHPVLLIAPGVHVSTAEAYRALQRPLTSPPDSLILREFQTVAWALQEASLGDLPLTNDFEEAVFSTHPQLASLARKLRRLGAKPVRMTGSGSALFGVFETRAEARAAAGKFPAGTAFPVRFVGRREYSRLWRRALGEQSTYVRP